MPFAASAVFFSGLKSVMFLLFLATTAHKSAVLRSRTRFLAMFSTHTPKVWLRIMILSCQKVDHAASYRAQVLPKIGRLPSNMARFISGKAQKTLKSLDFTFRMCRIVISKCSKHHGKGADYPEYASFHHVPFLYAGTRASGHTHKTQILPD